MKQISLALRTTLSHKGLGRAIKLLFMVLAVGLFPGCDPGIDFNPRGSKIETVLPANLEPHHTAGGKSFYQVACGQTATFLYRGISANIGLLSIHTVRSQADPPDCAVSVEIVKKHGDHPGVPYRRAVPAGESMTQAMDLDGCNTIEVIIKCEGTGNACVFTAPTFSCGKNSSNPNRSQAEILSNPQPHRTYSDNGIPCYNSTPTVLHKIYLDYPPGVGLQFQAVSKCGCANFVAQVSGRDDLESRAAQNSSGNTATVTTFAAGTREVTIYGHCDDTENHDDKCEGDVTINISAANKR